MATYQRFVKMGTPLHDITKQRNYLSPMHSQPLAVEDREIPRECAGIRDRSSDEMDQCLSDQGVQRSNPCANISDKDNRNSCMVAERRRKCDGIVGDLENVQICLRKADAYATCVNDVDPTACRTAILRMPGHTAEEETDEEEEETDEEEEEEEDDKQLEIMKSSQAVGIAILVVLLAMLVIMMVRPITNK